MIDALTAASPRKQKAATTWPILIPAIPILLVWVFFAGANPDEQALNHLRSNIPDSAINYWAYTAGGEAAKAFLMAAVLAVGLHFLFLKKRNPDASVRYWLILSVIAFAGLMVANGVVGERKVRNERAAGVIAYAQSVNAGLARDGAAYDAELKRIGWQTLLKPHILGGSGGVAAARGKIERAREAAETMHARRKTARDNILARINQLPAGSERDEAGSAFLRGYTDRNLPEFVNRELAVFDETEKFVDFMGRRRAHWRVRDGAFQFDNDKDIAEFRAHARRLDEVTTRYNDLLVREQGRWATGTKP